MGRSCVLVTLLSLTRVCHAGTLAELAETATTVAPVATTPLTNQQCLASKIPLGKCFIFGCVAMHHGPNVRCDGFTCVCKRGFCTYNNVTCQQTPTTTESPSPDTYGCDAVGVMQVKRDIKPGGKLFKSISLCTTGKLVADFSNQACKAAECTVDTVKVVAKDCWDQYPRFREPFVVLLDRACGTGAPGLALSASVTDSLTMYEADELMSDAEVAEVHREIIHHAEEALRGRVQRRTALALGVGGLFAGLVIAGLVVRQRGKPKEEEPVYVTLVA